MGGVAEQEAVYSPSSSRAVRPMLHVGTPKPQGVAPAAAPAGIPGRHLLSQQVVLDGGWRIADWVARSYESNCQILWIMAENLKSAGAID
ncbi:hypothetical protein [Streptomyces hygroscopicus]|uniref:hypothetical protein n=1 Tax=Streptomyces hygroscopicus TaxID=1912 RepID=UPI000783A6B7|nr:hypothetical protein [Streptomyces hygroscopicus]